jgi:AI-2 transport protein TqsA
MMALLQTDPTTTLIVAGGLLVIEQIMGNLIAPWVQGKQLSISPLVIMVSLMLWSWLWGVSGALLAVPMTVLLAITLSHIDGIRPFAVYFSDKSDVKHFEESTRAE